MYCVCLKRLNSNDVL
uniref:Uncharacterized protein n=1 Tax=Anguilla anguilla TaxID=7936 RepID=A0A0E9SN74_ANGAN